MSVAIIPARGGSKRIPSKNIRSFMGRPIIAWSLQAARESGCFERIIVSTDDEDIASVARAQGADVPFMRPASLSDDHTPTIPVIQHAIDVLALDNTMPVCCIYATAPFIRSRDLATGLTRLRVATDGYVFPVTRFAFPIQRALRRDDGGMIEMFQPEAFATRSQDLEEAWHDAGQFYWAKAGTWRAGRPVFGTGSSGIELPRHRVQDIDTEEDWVRAELMFKALKEQGE